MTEHNAQSKTLATLARIIDGEVIGDSDIAVANITSIDAKGRGGITFFKDKAYLNDLRSTQADAVILTRDYVDECPVSCIVVDDPYVAYAKVAQALHPQEEVIGGQHATAVVDETATIPASCWIGPNAIVEADVVLAEGVYIGPGSIVRKGARIGHNTRLMAMVHVGRDARIGNDGIVHPGVVIGGDGFGFANENGRWVKIPQIGSVIIGDDVEMGGHTCVDCGAINDTIVGNGVKTDNYVQIGHNAIVGDHTIMVAKSGVSGSTELGEGCTIAGGVGIAGHIKIAAGTVITAMSMVTHTIKEPGLYSSGVSVQDAGQWRRNHARLHQLDKTIKELKAEIRSLKKEAKGE
jgi:UDP-3-O-[3-hydroxymyristoyl] glucosamine N-acyltransferase